MPTPLRPAALGGTLLAALVFTAFLQSGTFRSQSGGKPDPIQMPEKPEDPPPGLPDPSAPVSFTANKPASPGSSKIQVAILLDVSNSMDGLIDQAKAQLWNMVSVLGKARCDGARPEVEIALYEYGRSSNNARLGYVQQINGFTRDLDQVSKNLFQLTTNGGDEYCGQVMLTSLSDLRWDQEGNHYKVIFIAGNEDFLQGSVPFTKACTMAKQKGVIVNTIYCGDRQQGLQEHWNLGAECGNGSFTFINSNAVIEDIATPYDDQLFRLNERLNATYISYGIKGEENKAKQQEADVMNYNMNKSVAAKRVAVKSSKGLYRNEQWDLVDASEADKNFTSKVDMKTLPPSLQGKSREELRVFVQQKAAERGSLQQEIEVLDKKRDAFLAAAKAKQQGAKEQTLETEIERIIRNQAGKFKMVIEK